MPVPYFLTTPFLSLLVPSPYYLPEFHFLLRPYFFCAADNAISLQVWATWLLYAVLVDLTDMVAEALAKPFADISMEMVYRALPFYVRAAHRHETEDLLAFLVADHKLFGLVKRKRPTHSSKKRLQPPLTDDLIP